MRYIRDHLAGRLPLAIAFWVNFTLLAVAYSLLEPLILAPLSGDPALFITATIALLIITRLVVLPWQLIGLLRSADHHYRRSGNPIVTRCVQGIVVIAVLFVLVDLLETAQSLVAYKNKRDYAAADQREIGYELRMSKHARILIIDGSLDFGITRDVEKKLAMNPNVVGVELNSNGGMIYEGRGLGLLFKRRALDTYVFGACSSACVTAFVGGATRYLGGDGKIGFHQYRFSSRNLHQFRTFYDVAEEQAKDLEVFETQGVSESFRGRIFARSGHEIWFPEAAELLTAGVVHAVREPSQPRAARAR